LVPLGAYDVARLPTPAIDVRIVRSSDEFRPLGAGAPDLEIPAVVYASGSEVICYAWNHRDSATTCLVPETHDALFIGEALERAQHQALDDAFAELRDGLIKSGTTVGDVHHVDRASPSTGLASM
jgi:DNA/RNA-binding domain of Phe-tRNA-synthetase-like protein